MMPPLAIQCLKWLLFPEESHTEELKWQDLLEICKKNVILIRVFDRLKKNGVVVPSFFEQAVTQEKIRIQKTIDAITRLSALLTQMGIAHVFTKSFMHEGDMGHDIDLLVDDTGPNTDMMLAGQFDLGPGPDSLANRVAGKKAYILEKNIDLEIHHARLGQVGEHKRLARHVLDNAVPHPLHRVPVPSLNDQFIVLILQRIYGHRSIRLTDVVQTVGLLKYGKLDRASITGILKQEGLLTGYRYYLSLIEVVFQQAFGTQLDSGDNLLPRASNLKTREGVVQVPLVPDVLFSVVWKAGHDLITLNGFSLGKLAFIPALAAWTLFRRRLS